MDKKEKSGRLYHIGITGSYGGLNLGDEAILRSIIDQLRESLDVKITVFTRNPEDTKKRHQVDQAVAVREATREEVLPVIRSLDLLIFGGGGILFDPEVKIFLREVQLAHELGVPVMVYAVSAGPLKDTATHPLVRDCLNQAGLITVRDRKACQLLEEIGVQKEIIVTADPAFLLKPEPVEPEDLKKEGIEKGRTLVAMSVREPGAAAPDLDQRQYHNVLANVADFIVERYEADVIFIPMERDKQDMQHSHAVISQMLRPQSANILKGSYSSGQVLSLMKYFRMAVGMRLHFLIFAAMQDVPFVALPYASKVHGLLERFQIEMPPMDLVNAGRIIGHIDRLWDHRRFLKDTIKKHLPEIRASARQNHELLLDLLAQKDALPEPKTAERLSA